MKTHTSSELVHSRGLFDRRSCEEEQRLNKREGATTARLHDEREPEATQSTRNWKADESKMVTRAGAAAALSANVNETLRTPEFKQEGVGVFHGEASRFLHMS